MKSSPIQLDEIQYVTVDVRAHPHSDDAKLDAALPISAKFVVTFAESGNHFVITNISQSNKEFSYSFELEAFASFMLDAEACKNIYSKSFNPAVVAVNIGTIMYSSMRDMLATVTSRAPWGSVSLPSVVVDVEDVQIEFLDDKRDEILKKHFFFSAKQLAILHESLELAEKTGQQHELQLPKESRKSTSKASGTKAVAVRGKSKARTSKS